MEGQLGTNEIATNGTTDFSSLTAPLKDSGQDVGAIINGLTARETGLTAAVSRDAMDLRITLDADDTVANAHAQELGSVAGAGTPAFSITDGGAVFNIGPEVNISNQVRLGVGNIAARNLGNTTDGYLDDLGSGQTNNIITGDLHTGQKIVSKAIDQVARLRGRIGTFQANTVGSSIRSMSISLENVTAAESAIRDTDFAAETANLTRNQILVQVASSILGMSNAQPQSILTLLRS